MWCDETHKSDFPLSIECGAMMITMWMWWIRSSLCVNIHVLLAESRGAGDSVCACVRYASISCACENLKLFRKNIIQKNLLPKCFSIPCIPNWYARLHSEIRFSQIFFGSQRWKCNQFDVLEKGHQSINFSMRLANQRCITAKAYRGEQDFSIDSTRTSRRTVEICKFRLFSSDTLNRWRFAAARHRLHTKMPMEKVHNTREN